MMLCNACDLEFFVSKFKKKVLIDNWIKISRKDRIDFFLINS